MANETRIEHASETWLADSTVFEVNRIPAHSDHKCYAHDPQTNEWSDLRQSLDGEWRVEVVQASDIEFNEEPFVRENFDDSAFERIQVPGHLQMAGLMNNKYVNIQYPWDGHENPAEPNIPENNHVALYRKTFTMANRLADTKNAGGTVSIVFHGMATAIYVWVNGMFVGYGEDGFTPNEFDITEMLHDGENVVAALLAVLPLLAPYSQTLAVIDSFYRAGALVFGGGHVVLPLLDAEVVRSGWVTPDAFLAGYGAAQAVPGPLFTFAAYLGAILGPGPNGFLGAGVALLAVFLPGFLVLVGVLPFWDQFRARPVAQSLMRGANAAVVGILGAALYSPVFTSAITDLRDFALAAAGFVALMVWKAPPWSVVALSAVAGIGVALLG